MKLMGGGYEIDGTGHGGAVSSLLYATPPPCRIGPKAPWGGGGGGGIGGGVQGGWHRDGYLANRVPPLTGSVSTQISSKWP